MIAPALLISLILALALPWPGPAGQIVERVACEVDSTRSYALYLPSAYSPKRQWPIVVLMDPRGRALVPLKLFVPAAERRGFILVSSYDTRSDGPAAPNVRAMNAVLPDVQRRFSIDPRRLYLAGFSGTARISWEFGRQLHGQVAGIIGFGGGLPEGLTLSAPPGFIFFGGAGTTDFNFEEMRALDARLERLGAAHRFRSYDGPHSWCAPDVCAEAIDWVEIRAMGAGLRERDAAMEEKIFSAWMKEARALESSGQMLDAAIRYKGIAQDFAGLRETAGPAAKADELARTRSARRAASLIERLAARQKAYEARLSSFITSFSKAAPPPAIDESLAQLQIGALKAEAAGAEEPPRALAARRLLALVMAHTSYYLPGDFMERNDPGRALAILKIAAAIEPASPGVCLGMARARARIGQKAEALEDLRCAAAALVAASAASAGGIDVSFIEDDPYLAPLRGEAGYREILDRLKGSKSGAP